MIAPMMDLMVMATEAAVTVMIVMHHRRWSPQSNASPQSSVSPQQQQQQQCQSQTLQGQ